MTDLSSIFVCWSGVGRLFSVESKFVSMFSVDSKIVGVKRTNIGLVVVIHSKP